MGTISKALELLNWFTPERAEIGLGEFARLTGRDKATVHRHLSELEANGFLEQHPISRAYRIGPALLRFSALREAAFPVRRLLQPIVEDLAESVGELAHASLLQGDALSPLAHSDPQLHGTQVHFDPSELLPLHATASGLSVMAFLPDERRDRILARPLSVHTNKTPTDPGVLRDVLRDIRETGLAAVDGFFDEEVASLGAPLFGEGNHVAGAIAIAIPRGRSRPRRLQDFAAKLRTTARQASRSLGGAYPEFTEDMVSMPGLTAGAAIQN